MFRTRARRWVVAAAAAVLVVGAAVPAAAAAPSSAQGARAGEAFAVQLHDAVAGLTVTPEDRTGYQRTAFKHWIDADKDGCNTRAEVLIDEAVEPPAVGPRCALTGGRWYSAYDDRYLDSASALDVDHMVPLAEAWDSGAAEWDAQTREAYANDLGDPRLLIAVSAASNRSKADKDPAEWMPPYEPYRCEYTANWIAMKLRWGLAVDDTERAALADQAAACPDMEITGTRAR